MSKRNIIILIICTIILIAVSVTTIKKEPEIDNIYLTGYLVETLNVYSGVDISLQDASGEKEEDARTAEFFRTNDETIYLVIEASHLETEDFFEIKWSRITDSSREIIQENRFNAENKGSGRIILSFVKIDNMYEKGNYAVEVSLNGRETKKKYFNVLPPSEDNQ